ncbi:MAG: hypothetical protein WD081_05340 [Gammaproteobacteria bacterium]
MAEPHPLCVAYARQSPGELAAFLVALGDDAIPQTLARLPDAEAAALVAHLPRAPAARVLGAQRDERIVEWLEEAALDDALAIALQLDEGRRTRVLDALPDRRKREALKRLLIYPQTAVGALADPTAVRLDASLPLGEALAILRVDRTGAERSVWLVDGTGRYVGLLDSSQALIAKSETQKLADLCISVRAIRADTIIADAGDYPDWQRYSELPVVDHLDHLLGALSRERLVAALGTNAPREAGLTDVVGELTTQYFHVMGSALGELFGRSTRR